ncbi:Methyltransferase domain-containing protein [Amycolatopsis lurida]|uniref:Methyltransferase n=1 Tax=Amycolatopsis lurida NRRL 2430 TaxID=1460371 RepID=A0A2P2FMS3_AMYLU|nr:class I SAM-dependent methyltransferase [Amycolatopsis lurida]KFU78033.1 methyltransferase [Amycolatopsis lurida NRRL 2430]SEE63894.1 Methyltransferase domain-containing protein [Amycolatopsis lurida]
MSGIVNTAQSEAWNGYEGRHWAEHDERYDAVNSGFNEFLFDAAGIGERDRVLDIGCGNGQVTRLAAVRAPLGGATGIDLSAPMLATARARAEAEGVTNVLFEQGDVQVFPFGDGVFDVALSRFAVTFFADPIAAFANVHRALRPGGKLAFLCMTALAGTDLGAVFGALAPFLPTPTGEDGTGPTAFADPARVRSVLTGAGFADVACDRVEADQVWGSDVPDAAGFIADWGPVKYHLGQVSAEAAESAREALSAALRPFEGPGGVRLRGAAWLVRANS